MSLVEAFLQFEYLGVFGRSGQSRVLSDKLVAIVGVLRWIMTVRKCAETGRVKPKCGFMNWVRFLIIDSDLTSIVVYSATRDFVDLYIGTTSTRSS